MKKLSQIFQKPAKGIASNPHDDARTKKFNLAQLFKKVKK